MMSISEDRLSSRPPSLPRPITTSCCVSPFALSQQDHQIDALDQPYQERRLQAYFNRIGRLLGTGHGGQVLLSQATADLVRDHLPEGVSLRDLGEYEVTIQVHGDVTATVVIAVVAE